MGERVPSLTTIPNSMNRWDERSNTWSAKAHSLYRSVHLGKRWSLQRSKTAQLKKITKRLVAVSDDGSYFIFKLYFGGQESTKLIEDLLRSLTIYLFHNKANERSKGTKPWNSSSSWCYWEYFIFSKFLNWKLRLILFITLKRYDECRGACRRWASLYEIGKVHLRLHPTTQLIWYKFQ